jgi:hypothetical protein
VSLLKDLADALAEALSGYSWSTVDATPSVSRSNWPSVDIDDMASPVIVVSPGTQNDITRVDRLRHQFDYQINVFVGRHTPAEAAADQMLEFTEEIVDVLLANDWGELEFPATSPMSINIDINPDEGLQERNVWRAVISVMYRTFR